MAEAFPEEFDNPEDPYNYVVWYLGPTEKDKYIFKGDEEAAFGSVWYMFKH